VIWVVAAAYHLGLVLLAFRVGKRNPAPGVVTFVVGVVAFQLVVNGPASFLDGGCIRYSQSAETC